MVRLKVTQAHSSKFTAAPISVNSVQWKSIQSKKSDRIRELVPQVFLVLIVGGILLAYELSVAQNDNSISEPKFVRSAGKQLFSEIDIECPADDENTVDRGCQVKCSDGACSRAQSLCKNAGSCTHIHIDCDRTSLFNCWATLKVKFVFGIAFWTCFMIWCACIN
jgi:hypothetical protein